MKQLQSKKTLKLNNESVYLTDCNSNPADRLFIDLETLAKRYNITIDKIMIVSKCHQFLYESIVHLEVNGMRKLAIKIQYIPGLLVLLMMTSPGKISKKDIDEWKDAIGLVSEVASASRKRSWF